MTVPREGPRNGLMGTVTEHIVGAPVLWSNISSESCSVRVPRNVFHGFQCCHLLVGGLLFNGLSVTAYSEALRPYQKPHFFRTTKPFFCSSSNAAFTVDFDMPRSRAPSPIESVSFPLLPPWNLECSSTYTFVALPLRLRQAGLRAML